MEKPIGFFISLALLTTMAVFATTRTSDMHDIETEEIWAIVPDTQVLVTDDLFKVLSAHGELSTFSTLLRASGLARELSRSGDLTVLAPQNDAFDTLPPGTVERLLMPEEKASLATVLKNHFVSGKVDASGLRGNEILDTVHGKQIHCNADGDGIMVEGARIMQPGLEMQQGVIHVIDKVLLAPAGTP